MRIDDFKPCPFCGNANPLLQEHPPHQHHFLVDLPPHPGSWTVECAACNVGMIANTRDELLQAWNLRSNGAQGLILDKSEVEFLAARVRRLCAKFEYPIGSGSDAFIVGVAGSLIGGILTNLELKERRQSAPEALVRLKDHLFRELVNDLRDIAVEWHSSQQLRERISGRLRKSIEPSATPCQGHARQQDGEESRCTWSLPTSHDEDNGIWHSSCGELWSFVDGGPEQNGVRYCQGCGKPVDVQPVWDEQEAKSEE